jgi:hypothetical protein
MWNYTTMNTPNVHAENFSKDSDSEQRMIKEKRSERLNNCIVVGKMLFYTAGTSNYKW